MHHRVLIDDSADHPGAVLAGQDHSTPRNARQRPPQKRVRGKFAPEHDPPLNGPGPTQPPRRPSAGGLIASDRLEGAAEIAMFLYGSDDANTVARLYHAVRRNRLPCGKDGGKLVASRAKLLAYWDAMTTSKSDGEGETDQP